MRLIHKAGGCEDGTCPNVFDTDQDDLVAVQGATLIDHAALTKLHRMPDHESVVLVPRSLLLEYAKAVTKET